MSLVIHVGFAQCALRFSLAGDSEEMVTTCGVAVVGTGITEADAIADQFITIFGPAFLRTGWVFNGVTLRVGQDGGPPAIVEAPRHEVGTDPPAELRPARQEADRAGRA